MTREWITTAEARVLTGRSSRALRRWRAQGRVRTRLADDARTVLLNRADVMRVEAETAAYATRPTFGRS